jgi:hypothetical protein
LNKFNREPPVDVPHPAECAELRKTSTAAEIFNGRNTEKDIIELTEKNYRNEIMINDYLRNNKPMYMAKGTFSGKIDGMDTNVEWENVVKI